MRNDLAAHPGGPELVYMVGASHRLVMRLRALRRQPHAQFDAMLGRDDFQFFDLIGRLHDAFGQGKADGEVFQSAGVASITA